MKTYLTYLEETIGPGELAALTTAYGAAALVGGNILNRTILHLMKKKREKQAMDSQPKP
jgi:hypothetical protein